MHEAVQFVVLDASSMAQVDATSLDAISQMIKDFQKRQATLAANRAEEGGRLGCLRAF